MGTALVSSIGMNMIVQMLLGFSMKKLWMLIGTLQIITHLAMLSIVFPSNALLCLNSLQDFSNMQLIPKQYVKSILGSLSNQGNSAQNSNFETMDIFERNHLTLFTPLTLIKLWKFKHYRQFRNHFYTYWTIGCHCIIASPLWLLSQEIRKVKIKTKHFYRARKLYQLLCKMIFFSSIIRAVL